MADIIFLVLLILHVVFVVAWLGGGVLFVSIITPALVTVSTNSRAEVIVAVLPRYTRFIGLVSTGAIVFGVLLLLYVNEIATSLAPSATGTPFIGVGALFGLIALIIAIAVIIPTGNRLVEALKAVSNSNPGATSEPSGATSAIPRLQRRLRSGAGGAVGLLTIALILMLIGASV
jgi:hypothetical protein